MRTKLGYLGIVNTKSGGLMGPQESSQVLLTKTNVCWDIEVSFNLVPFTKTRNCFCDKRDNLFVVLLDLSYVLHNCNAKKLDYFHKYCRMYASVVYSYRSIYT